MADGGRFLVVCLHITPGGGASQELLFLLLLVYPASDVALIERHGYTLAGIHDITERARWPTHVIGAWVHHPQNTPLPAGQDRGRGRDVVPGITTELPGRTGDDGSRVTICAAAGSDLQRGQMCDQWPNVTSSAWPLLCDRAAGVTQSSHSHPALGSPGIAPYQRRAGPPSWSGRPPASTSSNSGHCRQHKAVVSQ